MSRKWYRCSMCGERIPLRRSCVISYTLGSCGISIASVECKVCGIHLSTSKDKTRYRTYSEARKAAEKATQALMDRLGYLGFEEV